jgi:hypothetical protein
MSGTHHRRQLQIERHATGHSRAPGQPFKWITAKVCDEISGMP